MRELDIKNLFEMILIYINSLQNVIFHPEKQLLLVEQDLDRIKKSIQDYLNQFKEGE